MKRSGGQIGSNQNVRPAPVRRAPSLDIVGLLASAMVVAVGLFALGCERPASGDRYQIPWPDASGEYHLQAVRISGFSDPQHLSGSYAKIVVNPTMQNGGLTSDEPVGRFTNTKDGVNVPMDYASLQGAAVAAHIERLSRIDKELGVELAWPLHLAIDANLKDGVNSVRNNAVFDSHLDALLISPYTASALPIAVNAGILAHEHFHKIFETLVMSHLDSQKSRQMGCAGGVGVSAEAKEADAQENDATAEKDPIAEYNNFYLRAVNEGLADFWGWVYTGDVTFISHSLPSEAKRRTLETEVTQVKSLSRLQGYVHDMNGAPFAESIVVANAYSVGTDYARLFRELAAQVGDVKTVKGRLEVGREIIAALPAMEKEFETAQKQHHQISPNAPLRAVTKFCTLLKPLAASEAEPFRCEGDK